MMGIYLSIEVSDSHEITYTPIKRYIAKSKIIKENKFHVHQN